MTTLSIKVDDQSLARAREIAKARNMTVEEMVESLVRVIGKPLEHSELPPNTQAALGLLKGLPDRDYKDLLAEALMEKYGLDK